MELAAERKVYVCRHRRGGRKEKSRYFALNIERLPLARLGRSILGYPISNFEWSQFGQVEWVIFELFLLAPVLLSFVEDLRLPLGYGSAGCRVDSFNRSSD